MIGVCLSGYSVAQINLGKLKEKAEGAVSGNGSAGSGLTNDEVIAGLKEALSVGTDKSSAMASKEDGFFKNPAIKIPFPPEAQKVKDKAIKWGMQSQVDEFVMTMNRAAEEASKEAKPIFLNAVTGMSVGDGFAILKGEDNAATAYLSGKTRADLKVLFMPKVKDAMSKYNKSVKLTGGEEVNPDLEDYICERALDGLFVLIAAEELKIRQDPMARVSDLLSKVFGSLTD
jgi:putative sterol carrier protein